MNRPDVVAEEPLFLDEPEDAAPPVLPEAPAIDDLFADENAPGGVGPAPSPSARAVLPSAWRADRTANSAAAGRVRTPMLLSLIALGLLIGFGLVTLLR